jgi:hypothetical protein
VFYFFLKKEVFMKNSVFVRTLGLVAGLGLAVSFTGSALAQTVESTFTDVQCRALVVTDSVTLDSSCEELADAGALDTKSGKCVLTLRGVSSDNGSLSTYRASLLVLDGPLPDDETDVAVFLASGKSVEKSCAIIKRKKTTEVIEWRDGQDN